MRITVRLFAILRDCAGRSQLPLDLPNQPTIAAAVEKLAELYPQLRQHRHVAFAINQSYVESDAILNEGDELAIIPPVSGG